MVTLPKLGCVVFSLISHVCMHPPRVSLHNRRIVPCQFIAEKPVTPNSGHPILVTQFW